MGVFTCRIHNTLQSRPQRLLRSTGALEEHPVLKIVTGTSGNELGWGALGRLGLAADGKEGRNDMKKQKKMKEG